MRLYMQKKASIAEGVLFNLCQNPSLLDIVRAERKGIVEIANDQATKFMKEVYLLDIVEKEPETEKAEEAE